MAKRSAISELEKRVAELEAQILEARIAELEPKLQKISQFTRRLGFSAGEDCTFACTQGCTHTCTTCCAGEIAAERPKKT